MCLLEGGLEPPHLSELPPQSSVSTNSTIRAREIHSKTKLETDSLRVKDFYLF